MVMVVWVGKARMHTADMRVVGHGGTHTGDDASCVVAEANGGDGLGWLKPIVEAACMHVWALCQALVWVVMLRCQT
jgi:hypothetical protein